MGTGCDILIFCNRPGNARLLMKVLECAGYSTCSAVSHAELLESVAAGSAPMMALIDIGGRDSDEQACCTTLKTHAIPFVILATSPRGRACDDRWTTSGARTVVVKPVAKQSLVRLVRDIASTITNGQAETGPTMP